MVGQFAQSFHLSSHKKSSLFISDKYRYWQIGARVLGYAERVQIWLLVNRSKGTGLYWFFVAQYGVDLPC